MAEKPLAVGTLAESIQGLGTATAARETGPEVWGNATFWLSMGASLLGILLQAGGASVAHVGMGAPGWCHGNISGALAHLLMASSTRKPEPRV